LRNAMTKIASFELCKWRIICIRNIFTYHWAENKRSRQVWWTNNGRFLTKGTRNIQLCLATLMAFIISKETKTRYIVKELATLYQKPLASNTIFLMKHLFNMKMSEVGSIVDHLNKFNTITSLLSYVGVKFHAKVRALLFLFSLL